MDEPYWSEVTRDPATWPPEGVDFVAWVVEPYGRTYDEPGKSYSVIGRRDGEWFRGQQRMGVIVTHWCPLPRHAPQGIGRKAE